MHRERCRRIKARAVDEISEGADIDSNTRRGEKGEGALSGSTAEGEGYKGNLGESQIEPCEIYDPHKLCPEGKIRGGERRIILS